MHEAHTLPPHVTAGELFIMICAKAFFLPLEGLWRPLIDCFSFVYIFSNLQTFLKGVLTKVALMHNEV